MKIEMVDMKLIRQKGRVQEGQNVLALSNSL